MKIQKTFSEEKQYHIILPKIKCKICGMEFEKITCFHLKKHGITMYEYREQFPDALLASEGYKRKLSLFRKSLCGEKNPFYGKHHSEEAKQKQRDVHLGKHHSEETKQLMRDSSPHLSGGDAPMYGNEPWNKGKTKETDEGVRKVGKNISKAKKEFFATEEGQQWLDEHNRGKNHHFYGNHHSKEAKQKMSISRLCEKNHMYGKHHTEEAKQKQREAHLGKHPTEEAKQLMSEKQSGEGNGMYGKHHTEEAKQKMRGSRPNSSDENNHMFGNHHSDGTKQLMSDNHADVSGEKNPMYGMTGENAPGWQGGISYLPYCEKFDNDLKERIRDFFGRCCYICGMNEAENGQRLSVHHVNYDKMVCCNDVKPLFVPLCKSCHTKTLKDRDYWEEFFTISLNYLTDGKCFLPKSNSTKDFPKNNNKKAGGLTHPF